MGMKSLRKKQNRYRGLRAVSYFLGFPLLLLVVFVASVPFMNGDAFVDVKYYGIIACAVVWGVCIVGQILISLITKSNTGRTLFMLILTLILTIGGTVFCDLYVSKKFDEINANENYKAAGVSVESYKYQAGWVITWSSKESLTDLFSDEVAHFCEVYNVKYKSSIYADYPKDEEGKDIKTNGYINPDGSPVTYNKEDDAYYSPNGLYADGYVFGVKQALKVIIDYYEAREAVQKANPIFEKNNNGSYVKLKGTGEMVLVKDEDGEDVLGEDGETTLVSELRSAGKIEGYYALKGYKDADTVLEEALAAQAADPNSDWNEYKKSDEYQAAYGDNGSVYRFMFNEERLAALVRKLFFGIGSMEQLNGVISLASNIGFNVNSLLQSYIGITVNEIKDLDLDGLLDVLNNKMSSELRETLTPTLNGFGISFPVTKASLVNLVSGFIYYQSPTTKPDFMFLDDADLVKYATAKYEGQTHGANVGSVLIPTKQTETSLTIKTIAADKAAAYKTSDDYKKIKEDVVLIHSNDDGTLSVVMNVHKTTFSNVGKITMSDSGYPVDLVYGTTDPDKLAQATLKAAYQLQADDSAAIPYYPLLVARRFLMVFAGVLAVTYVVCFYANRRAHEFAAAIDKSTISEGIAL